MVYFTETEWGVSHSRPNMLTQAANDRGEFGELRVAANFWGFGDGVRHCGHPLVRISSNRGQSPSEPQPSILK